MPKIILLCFFFYALLSCEKKESPQPLEEKPIQIETLLPESLGSQGIKLSGRVLSLNHEKINEHGFILTYRSGFSKEDSAAYIINTEIRSGSNFTIINDLPLSGYDGQHNLTYYVKTNNRSYKGNSLKFGITPVLVEPQPESYVYPGQEIRIPGDFEKLDDSYRIISKTSSTIDGNPIPYELSSDKNTLIFRIPNNWLHGTERDLALYNAKSNDVYLTKVLVVGRLNPPPTYQYYYDETVKFTGVGLGRNMQKPFLIVFGDKLVPYQGEYQIKDLLAHSTGTSYRIGYYNGLDTILFPNKFQLRIPSADVFKFRQQTAHPSSTISVNAGELARYIPILNEMPRLGDKPTFLIPMWNYQDRLTIEDVPDGSYPAVFKNHIHTYTSGQTINIQQLKVNTISPTSIYMGEKVTLSGNFINGMTYTVVGNEGSNRSLMAANGALTFSPPSNIHIDDWEIKQVGYHNERGKATWVDTHLKVEIKPTTFTDFSPTIGTHDTKITLYGQGLPGARIYVAGQWVQPYEGGPGYVAFYIPRYILPGKHKIALQYKNQWLTVDQLFELK